MKKSRGRFSTYKVLQSAEKINAHLLETELFSEDALHYFLEKYKAIVIKPVFGPDEIYILLEQDNYFVAEHEFTDETALYNYLIDEKMEQTHYIIQPQKLHTNVKKNPFHFYMTAHRKHAMANWYIGTMTERFESVFGMFFYQSVSKEIERITLTAAHILGETFTDCYTIVIEIVLINETIWIQDAVLHFSISKWSQFHSLITMSAITPFIPATQLLTEKTMIDYLNQFHAIIIKPCQGQHGKGVIQITKKESSLFEIHAGRTRLTMSSHSEAYQFIQRTYLKKKEYLVQPRLPLATIDGCLIDSRVVAQKHHDLWEITGKLVKVAIHDFIITNAAGKLLSFEQALKEANISLQNKEMLERRIDHLCLAAVKLLETVKPELVIIGFDIGITKDGDIWMIEGNYKPDISMFYEYDDKTIYMKIWKLSKESKLH